MDKFLIALLLSSTQNIIRGPVSQAIIPPLTTFAPSFIVQPTTTTIGVDQLATTVATMSMEDQPQSSPAPIKRGQDQDKHSPMGEDSPKWTRLFGDVVSWSTTPFHKLPSIIPTRVPHTLEEVIVVVFPEDLSFIQNLIETDKMELLSGAIYHTYRVNFLFSLVSVGQCDVLVVGNHSKKRDNQKGKYENIEHKCSKFHKDTISLKEKVIRVYALQEEANIHGSPSILATQIGELESSLKVEKKQKHVTSDVVTKEDRRAKEARKTLQQEKESRAEESSL